MKIEVGKFYKCRDGNKARIYAVDDFGSYPIRGACLIDQSWSSSSWCEDGMFYRDGIYLNRESGLDIIGEWEE